MISLYQSNLNNLALLKFLLAFKYLMVDTDLFLPAKDLVQK